MSLNFLPNLRSFISRGDGCANAAAAAATVVAAPALAGVVAAAAAEAAAAAVVVVGRALLLATAGLALLRDARDLGLLLAGARLQLLRLLLLPKLLAVALLAALVGLDDRLLLLDEPPLAFTTCASGLSISAR